MTSSIAAADLSQIQKIAHPTLTHRVYEDLRELLLAGQVLPGQKLTLRSLADALGTSQMPVREAVRQLAAEGAIEILPNKGMRVPLMTKDKFRELLRIRLALEGLAVEQAASLVTDEELEEINGIHDRLAAETRSKTGDLGEVISLNKQLHFAIYRASRMPALVALIESIWLQVGPVLNFDIRAKSSRFTEAPALGHHAGMVEGMNARSPVQARAGLSGDLMSAAEIILAGNQLPERAA
ncbi:MAG: GntR family transcriptional regulator [Noviherbaspirillum sp.]